MCLLALVVRFSNLALHDFELCPFAKDKQISSTSDTSFHAYSLIVRLLGFSLCGTNLFHQALSAFEFIRKPFSSYDVRQNLEKKEKKTLHEPESLQSQCRTCITPTQAVKIHWLAII